MYFYLLIFHSFFRWLVLASLSFAIFRAWTGWIKKLPFTGFDNSIRHWTATIAHIQLVLGITLYIVSPLTQYFRANFHEAVHDREIRFFGMEHSLVMTVAILVLTIGSMLAKRKLTDTEKFKTMAWWFTASLLLLLTSIPWQFSPLVSRPYFRFF
ncbi:MAG: hypothetical protein U0T73_12735 [Chitinophagales bacterium]